MNAGLDAKLKAVYRLPNKVVQEFIDATQRGMRDVVVVAKELGLTTLDDGVLVHPELGPTGFVAPTEERRNTTLMQTDVKVEVNGREEALWVFAADDKGVIKDVETFSRYMAEAAHRVPVFPLWLTTHLLGDRRHPAFHFVLRRTDSGDDVIVMFVEDVPDEVRDRLIELGGKELTDYSLDDTVESYGQRVIESNMTPGGGAAVSDAVDVQVRRQ